MRIYDMIVFHIALSLLSLVGLSCVIGIFILLPTILFSRRGSWE
jgi:hypothetical protein